MKRFLFRLGVGLATLGMITAGAAAFSAFEAHIVNVTARIENATGINTATIGFGTVFPQEYLTQNASIGLSESFKAQQRVNTVHYVLKQKPKVKLFSPTGDPNDTPRPGDPYQTIQVGQFTGPAWKYCEDNLPVGSPYTFDPTNPYWRYCYLPLANYLSKHSSRPGDLSVNPFHLAYQWSGGISTAASLNPQFIASGTLTPATPTTTWAIDLAVPCFANQCAQDWFNFVRSKNPAIETAESANRFMLPAATEHKVFGTDLWFEVDRISGTTTTTPT